MPFEFEYDDFNRIANAALNDATCDFKKSKVADRLRTVQGLRHHVNAAPTANDSLDLRRNLANVINGLYRNEAGGRVVIPASVARALKVDRLASGFKLQADGSLVATDHPLTDRRLVAIMTAIRLDRGQLGTTCAALDDAVARVLAQAHGVAFGLFDMNAGRELRLLTATIRAAGAEKVLPATLKRFLPALTGALDAVREQFLAVESQLSDAERTDLRDIVTRALALADEFGTQVAALPPLPPVAPIRVVNDEDLERRDVLERNLPPQPSREEICRNHREQVLFTFDQKLGEAAKALGLDLLNVLPFSKEDLALFETTGEAVDRRIAEKAEALAAAVNRLATAELDDAHKRALILKAVAAEGVVDEEELKAAVDECRAAAYRAIAEAKRQTFAADVAREVLEAIDGDKSLETGLANLKRDFPMLKSFAHLMKRDHVDAKGKPDPLSTYDLKAEGVLAGLLDKRLGPAGKVFDKIDITLERDAFERGLEEALHATSAAIARNLKAVLAAAVFEDDRTRLMLLALEPGKEAEFAEGLAAALKRYEDNVFGRAVQSMMTNKMAAAQMKPRSLEEPAPKISAAFHAVHNLEPAAPEFLKPPTPAALAQARKNWTKPKQMPLSKDELDLGRGESVSLGEKMRLSVRNLFADFFAPATRTAEGLREAFWNHREAVQAMMLDPALVETTAVPGEKEGGDALRALLRQFFKDIAETVNAGQLTPADFNEAFRRALEGPALARFAEGRAEAGRKVLASLQVALTANLTDVLRRLTRPSGKLALSERTLAELGATGIGSFDEGYGKFLANVLDNYFTDEAFAQDRDRMLESLMRYGKTPGSVGDALGALIKGAGPIFQKVLQSLPLEGLPEEIVKALMDVKSALAPIPPKEIRARLDAAIAKNNAAGRPAIAAIEIKRTLGAASVGEAVLCTIHYADAKMKDEEVVIKFLRPGIREIALRERAFFDKMAARVDAAMVATFRTRMDGIMEELDFTNEAKWIERGACYGEAGNYGDAAELKGDEATLSFESMGRSLALDPQPDLLALKVAPGKPLDRQNRETRARLDAITRGLVREEKTEKGLTRRVYRAKGGLEFVENYAELVRLYDRTNNAHKMLAELLRRFSSELFWRNYDGKGAGGGFMHGDLHAGNLLVGEKTMTVIDFGNSFAFTRKEREQLVSFVAACGFAHGEFALEIVAPGLSKTEGYAALLKDVKAILAKGDANDVVARGMAVVQYLQKHNVTVPGVIMNFTETVMRLSTACEETAALMEDLAGVIAELKVDPAALARKDPFADHIEDIFTDRMDGAERRRLKDKLTNMGARLGELARPEHVLTEEEYATFVAPVIALLRNSRYIDEYNPPPRVVGKVVRSIEEHLRLLGKEAFAAVTDPKTGQSAPKYALVPDLMFDLYSMALTAARHFGDDVDKVTFRREQAEGVNDALQAGLTQLGKPKLLSILGTSGIGMAMDGSKVMAKADLVAARRRIARDAQGYYLHREGLLELKTRRFVDRTVRDHFIWNELAAETTLGGKWYREPKNVAAVTRVLRLNLDKLHAALEAVKWTGDIHEREKLDNYALIAFALPQGLVDALQALSPQDYAKVLETVRETDAEVAARLDFLRKDEALVDAVRIGRCTATAAKCDEFNYNALLRMYRVLRTSMKPLARPFTFKGPAFELVRDQIKAFYDEMVAENKDADIDKTWLRAIIDYAFMRYLLEEGFLQALSKEPNPSKITDQFKTGGFFGDGSVRDMLNRLLGYMK